MAPKRRSGIIRKAVSHSGSNPESRQAARTRRDETSLGKTVRFRSGASMIQGPSGKTRNDSALSERQVQHGLAASSNEYPGHDRTAGPASLERVGVGDKDSNIDDTINFEEEIQDQFVRDAPDVVLEPRDRSVDFDSASLANDSIDSSDGNMCRQMLDLLHQIKSFAEKNSRSSDEMSSVAKREYMEMILKKENAELARYIGYLATGGPEGEDSWADLLCNETCRRALIIGIVNRALKETVFDSLWFGASEEQEHTLDTLEKECVNEDGFLRNQRIAEVTSKFPHHSCDQNFARAGTKLTLQLAKLIAPLWAPMERRSKLLRPLKEGLRSIVDCAGIIGREMRQTKEVIYYFPPTVKDELFQPCRMECLNLDQMLQDSPYEKQEVEGQQIAVLQPGNGTRCEALVRIVCSLSVEAYRKGGGILAEREIAKQKRDRSFVPPDVQRNKRKASKHANVLTSTAGFRVRMICKGVVLLHWGKQRLLTKEAGTPAYIRALQQEGGLSKYGEDHDGSIEFYDMATKRWSMASRDASQQLSRGGGGGKIQQMLVP